MENINTLIERLESKCFDLESRIEKSEKEINELEALFKTFNDKQIQLSNAQNNIEQYSRKNSVSVYGLQEATSENTTQVFLHLEKTKLELNIKDCAIDSTILIDTNHYVTSCRVFCSRFAKNRSFHPPSMGLTLT